MTNNAPNGDTYRWPAEWERHDATWLAWPHNRDTWPGAFPNAIAEYEELAKTIARFEPVNIVATGKALRHAESAMSCFSNVSFFDIPTNDAWIRDHGPIFVVESQRANERSTQVSMVDFEYNAWGEKYPPFDDDNLVPKRIADATGYRRIDAPFILEGGAIDGNGQGIVLTSKSCLLNSNRNTNWKSTDAENLLRKFLLVDHVLWLEGEIPGDDTDGHIDQMARFVAEDTILYCCDAESVGWKANADAIRDFTAKTGKQLNTIEIPMPHAKHFGQLRLPASYANFYILNEAVIVPAFDDANDETARRIIEEFFPTRETVSLSASSLVVGLGAFHCLTQQQPACMIASK